MYPNRRRRGQAALLGRSSFMMQLDQWISSFVESELAADRVLAIRLLRMTKLLCEGHNAWWQRDTRVHYGLTARRCKLLYFQSQL